MSLGYSIIDTPDTVTSKLPWLRGNGITTCIRYLAAHHSWKTIGTAEARAMGAAGMRLGLVFENDGKPHGFGQGRADGHSAFSMAREVGAPGSDADNAPGRTVLWYTVDYDPSPTDMIGITQAFQAFRAEVGPYYRVGAYCSGYCATRLVAAGALDSSESGPPLVWITQSMGFRGSRDYLRGTAWTLVQRLPTYLNGLDVDPNVQNLVGGAPVEFGDFLPDFSPPAAA